MSGSSIIGACIVRLGPQEQREFKSRIAAFDVETADNNQSFVCGSVVDDERNLSFDVKEAMQQEILSRDGIMFATNLSFDLFALFGQNAKRFRMLWNNARLLKASHRNDHDRTLQFWDTLNLAPGFSVEKLGKVAGLPKMPTPAAIGRWPGTTQEREELKAYNVRDSRVTFEAAKFFIKEYTALGATMKFTLPSCAMSLWRNKYLDRSYWQPGIEQMTALFKGYYGGRTEAFARGRIKNMYLYDVNSLYPHVMRSYPYPDMNTLRDTRKNDDEPILYQEGMADVTITIEGGEKGYPPLAYRLPDKLIFPTGTMRGWWTHEEIRGALDMHGARLIKVHRSIYARETCEPFTSYVDDLYALRLSYQQQHDAREIVVKLLMNSLYGKFGQKFMERENMELESNFTLDQLQKLPWFQRVGDYIRIKRDCRPSAFCNPLWAAHITAYARKELRQHLLNHNALYCDTDSVVSRRRMSGSSGLGKLKLEMVIDEGIIVRPKFYAFRGDRSDKVKLKGCMAQMNYAMFEDFLVTKKASWTKFTKLREALRRHLPVNGLLDVTKTFSLEDGKRRWAEPFSMDKLQWSEPLSMEDLAMAGKIKPILEISDRENQADGKDVN